MLVLARLTGFGRRGLGALVAHVEVDRRVSDMTSLRCRGVGARLAS